MNKKQLINLGVKPECVDVAVKSLQTAARAGYFKGRTPRKIFKDILDNPATYQHHEYFGHFASALLVPEEPEYQARELAPFKVWGNNIDEAAIQQMRDACSLPITVRGAMMSDSHVGYSIGIGGVLATDNAVIPLGVGVDIACRMKISILDTPPKKLDSESKLYERALEDGTIFGIGGTWKKSCDHPVMDMDWNITSVTKSMKDRAWTQLGTSGSGNHFVEFGVVKLNEELLGIKPGEYVALLSHSGSRGAGANVCQFYSDVAKSKLSNKYKKFPAFRGLAWLDLNDNAGAEYWAAMNLMGEYASGNHACIHRNVTKLAGAEVLGTVENHHNFCIPASERIQTTLGPKHIAELKVGDKVYAVNENKLEETIVTKVWHSGKKSIYTIKTAHRKLRVSGDHPILVQRDKNEWIQASDLKVEDLIVCAEGYYDNKTILQKGEARFIGAYLGDGWIRAITKRRGYTFGLAIGNAIQKHTHQYAKLITSLKTPEVNKGTWKNKALSLSIDKPGAFGITGSNKRFYHYIVSLGLGQESTIRRLPPSLFTATKEDKLDLLSGYFDADGSIGYAIRRDASGLIRACNEDLVHDLREIAISISMDCTPVRRQEINSNFGDTVCFACNISPISMKMLNLWHKNKRVIVESATPRKVKKLISNSTHLFIEPIQKITITGKEDVYDLTVDHNSHSFICSGVVVHNCWKETHNGKEVVVHRKGATPAGAGVLGVIPGSMADPAFIVRGKGNPDSLLSASHGAGRAMSRTKARQEMNWSHWKNVLRQRGVKLLSGGLDEVPGAYKPIREVMAAQTDLVEIIGEFMPRIVKMSADGRSED